ncbi:MAG: hypothetical protein ACRBBW_00510 [Cellvibrionaceae bacterium]
MMDLQRLDIGNALYYVELKSNGHRPLFAERSGFSAFIDLLTNLEQQTGSRVIAHCLLQDTVYLVIQNGAEPLLQSTRYLTEQYTQFAQEQWRHHGSLFNKHHHWLLLEPSRYLLPCIQYLHHRPVAMGLVAEASIYPWSSLQSYSGENPQPWLHASALQQFTGLATVRRNTHLECLNQPPSEPMNLQQGNHPDVWALASDTFIQHLLQRNCQATPAPTLEWLTTQVCDRHHITREDLSLRQGHRRYLEVRAEIAALALELANQEPVEAAPNEAEPDIETEAEPHIETTQDSILESDEKPAQDPETAFSDKGLDDLNNGISDDDGELLPITAALAQAIESQLETSMAILAPQILTLKETRPHYLHGLYLDLRRQWRQHESRDIQNETEDSAALDDSIHPHSSAPQSSPEETDCSTAEESSSISD